MIVVLFVFPVAWIWEGVYWLAYGEYKHYTTANALYDIGITVKDMMIDIGWKV